MDTFPRFSRAGIPAIGTPWIAIVFSAVVYSLLAGHSLTQLISVYIWLCSATTVLTVLSAWKLRNIRPEMPRPFRVPGGIRGLAYVVVAPAVMAGLALLGSDRIGMIGGAVTMALGPIVYVTYLFLRRIRTEIGHVD